MKVHMKTAMKKCGHVAVGASGDFCCDKPHGHKGLHGQTAALRDGTSTTNWGDDGLAPWATKYPENGSYMRVTA